MPDLISGCKLVKQNVVVYLWLTLDHGLHLCNRQWYAVTHDALQPAFVTTVTSTVRYSWSQLLSVDRYATRDTGSRLTGCVNLLLRQLCISTRRKHRGGRKIAKQIETIVHCARVPTLPQRSRNVHNVITLPLCKQVSKTRDQGVRVCYVNAQSCRNKTLAIADHILDNQLDMTAISETWLKSSHVPNRYCIKHTPRPIGKGGGVAIIHKSEIV